MIPVDAVIAVTYRCNARCAMCGIWKTEPCADLTPEICRKLPASLRDINLTGGEPYLHENLPAIHAACRQAAPRAQTVVSTNGILTDHIIAATREMARAEPGIGVAISIDGPAQIHDQIRGLTGAFGKAMQTVRALQNAGITNLRLAFTAGPQNVQYMNDIYVLARENGAQFTCAIEHTSEHYFHSAETDRKLPLDVLRSQLFSLMQNELHSLSPKRWARAYFMRGQYQFASGRGRLLPCRAGLDHFFMTPSAEIYTCNAAPYIMGNLQNETFDTIWQSDQAETARENAGHCKPGCWMICTARTAIKAGWARVLCWALKSKLLGVSLGERP